MKSMGNHAPRRSERESDYGVSKRVKELVEQMTASD